MRAEKEIDYTSINRRAYNVLASQYGDRRESDREKDLSIVRPFVDLLRDRFFCGIRVIDVGCGNGLNVGMFLEEGFDVTGIDISPGMLRFARESAPGAKMIRGDFLRNRLPAESFEGVFAKAFVHLFPKPVAMRVLQKIRQILVPGGIFYVTTTDELSPHEGVVEKSDYHGAVVRFRRRWTSHELLEAVRSVGFEVVSTSYNDEPNRHKRWFNVWAKRPENENLVD